MSTRNRAGFTLVELLVVIAIIGILVSLISAAAMQAINTAQRTSCQHNQHNIWGAVQTYESRKQRYPGWRTALAGHQVSWAVQLMPYLELADVYNQCLGKFCGDGHKYVLHRQRQYFASPEHSPLCLSQRRSRFAGRTMAFIRGERRH